CSHQAHRDPTNTTSGRTARARARLRTARPAPRLKPRARPAPRACWYATCPATTRSPTSPPSPRPTGPAPSPRARSTAPVARSWTEPGAPAVPATGPNARAPSLPSATSTTIRRSVPSITSPGRDGARPAWLDRNQRQCQAAAPGRCTTEREEPLMPERDLAAGAADCPEPWVRRGAHRIYARSTGPAGQEQCLKPVDRPGRVYLPGVRIEVSSNDRRWRAGREGTTRCPP